MAGYRLCFLESDGRVRGMLTLICEDDQKAIERAARFKLEQCGGGMGGRPAHSSGTSVRQASLRRAFVGPMVGRRLARARVLVPKFGCARAITFQSTGGLKVSSDANSRSTMQVIRKYLASGRH
jgi:hypothetical protein